MSFCFEALFADEHLQVGCTFGMQVHDKETEISPLAPYFRLDLRAMIRSGRPGLHVG